MRLIDELWRYDGRRAVVTGCASGIGAQVARQLTELGAHVVGLDRQPPSGEIAEFHCVDLSDPESIDRGVASVGDQVDGVELGDLAARRLLVQPDDVGAQLGELSDEMRADA